MAAKTRKNKLTREETRRKKSEADRLRYQRLKNDPLKREELREKESIKYQKQKEKGLRKLVKDMSPSEHKKIKKKWKVLSNAYRYRKKASNTVFK